MIDLLIEPSDGCKGRVFPGGCAAFLTAYNHLPDTSGGVCIRPAWAAFAGPDQAIRPFVANLKLGRKARRAPEKDGPETRFEFLRSMRYAVDYQRDEAGTIATMYSRELFRLEPEFVDSDGVSFVCLVPEDWAAAQDIDDEACARHALRFLVERQSVEELVPFAATAALVAAYLDARTRCPIVADPRFYMQLLVAAFNEGHAALPLEWSKYGPSSSCDTWQGHAGFTSIGLDGAGVRHAVSFVAKHEEVESLLAEQTALWFEVMK